MHYYIASFTISLYSLYAPYFPIHIVNAISYVATNPLYMNIIISQLTVNLGAIIIDVDDSWRGGEGGGGRGESIIITTCSIQNHNNNQLEVRSAFYLYYTRTNGTIANVSVLWEIYYDVWNR